MLRAVALAGLLAVAPAGAEPPPPAGRAAVESRLRAHGLPQAPAAWKALGSRVDEVLVAIGGDAKVEAPIRARAMGALAFFPTPAARRFLEDTIERRAASSDPSDRLMVRRAAVALGWIGGVTAAARLGPLIENADPDVRQDAAVGLGLTRLPAAADLLRKRLAAEPVARVRAHIERQLRTIESALAAAPVPRPGHGERGDAGSAR